MDCTPYIHFLQIDGEIRFLRCLVRVVYACESFDFAVPRFSINASFVSLLAVLETSSNVDKEEATMLRYCLTSCVP